MANEFISRNGFIAQNNSTINGTLLVSGSLSGTASFAISASQAQTASYVLNAVSASYVQNAQTASYVVTAQTASYVLNAISSSFALTASTTPQLYRIVNNTDSANTSATILTSIYSQLIPANTFAAGDVIRLSYRGLKTGSLGGCTIGMYSNTSNSTSGATLLAQYSLAAIVRMSQLDRKLYIKNATTNTEYYNTTINIYDDYQPTATAVAWINSSINWTVGQYIIFTITLFNGGDSFKGSTYEIERIRQT